jgi:hypothetical protein
MRIEVPYDQLSTIGPSALDDGDGSPIRQNGSFLWQKTTRTRRSPGSNIAFFEERSRANLLLFSKFDAV